VLPSLLQVLEGNTHREYPQDLAEVGFVAQVDPTEPTGVAEHRSVAAVVARHDASYEDARGRLQALANAFDGDLETPATDHPSFLDGRVADVVIDGVTGALDPDLGVAVERALACDRQACRRFAEANSWEAVSRRFLEDLAPWRRDERRPSLPSPGERRSGLAM
jgi:hypothetical protein